MDLYYPETDDTLAERIAETIGESIDAEHTEDAEDAEEQDSPLGDWLSWTVGPLHRSGRCVAVTIEGRPIVETDSGKLLYAPKDARRSGILCTLEW